MVRLGNMKGTHQFKNRSAFSKSMPLGRSVNKMKDIFIINRIDHKERIIFCQLNQSEICLEVPSLFGDILDAKLRKDFILVHTFEGRVSFHANGDLKGLLHWHCIRKNLKEKCLLNSLTKRVDFHITHYHWGKQAKSKIGASGRITLDKNIIINFSFNPNEAEFEPFDLGAALAQYLYLDPIKAIESKNIIISAFALLDKRLSTEDINNSRNTHNHKLWSAFKELRNKNEITEKTDQSNKNQSLHS